MNWRNLDKLFSFFLCSVFIFIFVIFYTFYKFKNLHFLQTHLQVKVVTVIIWVAFNWNFDFDQLSKVNENLIKWYQISFSNAMFTD